MLKKFIKDIFRYLNLLIVFRTYREFIRQKKAPLETPWGFVLAGNMEMAIGKYESNETRLVRSLLPNVDILINVGANVGYYCCHALSLNKKVIAFEPLPRNLHFLNQNINRNNWGDSAEVFPVALAESSGIVELYGDDTGASLIKGWADASEDYVYLAPVNTLDRMLGDSIENLRAIILVDIEGSELSMLRRAIRTLESVVRPIWIMEIVNWQNQPTGVTFNPDF